MKIPDSLLAQAHLGSWRWEVEPDVVVWSPELYRIFGYDPDLPPPTWSEHGRLFSAESFQELEGAVLRCLAHGEPFLVHLVAVRNDGNPLFVDGYGAAGRDESGKITHLFGLTLDRTSEREAKSALRRIEKRFQTTFEQIPVGLAILEIRTSRFISVNQAYCDIIGMTAQEIMATTFEAPFGCVDGWKNLRMEETAELKGKPVVAMETCFLRADGKTIWTHLTVSPLQEIGDALQHEIYVMEDTTLRREAERQRLLAEEDLGKVILQERDRLAFHMHDGVGQLLTGMMLKASHLAADPLLPDEAREGVLYLVNLIWETHERIRSIVRGLASDKVDAANFVPALRRLISAFTAAFQVHCEYQGPEECQITDDDHALHLYLIAQEAMLNSVRHAQAGHIVLAIERNATGLHLRVTDDGSGMETSADLPGSLGVGLRAMRSRAASCGGILEIVAGAQGGTQVVCQLPDL